MTIAWAPRRQAPGTQAPGRVAVVAKAAETVFEGDVPSAGATFDAPNSALQLVFTVMSQAGEVIDRETRTLEAFDASAGIAFDTPVVLRARNPAELKAILDSPATAKVEAAREFVRTDRLFIRFAATGAASVTARLMDRRGANLVALPVQTLPTGGYQVDLPLASIAAGEFVVALDAANGATHAEAMVSFRVVQRPSGQ